VEHLCDRSPVIPAQAPERPKVCPAENTEGFSSAEDKSLAVEISPQIFKFDKGAAGTEQKLTEVGTIMVIFGFESV